MSARTAVLEYLTGSLHRLAVRVGVPETDAPDGYQYVISQALRTAGLTADAASIPAATETNVQLLADYYALLKLQREAAPLVNRTERLPGDETVYTTRDGDVYEHITRMLATVRAQVEAAGLITNSYTPTLRTAAPVRGDLAAGAGSEYRRGAWYDGDCDA